MPLRKAAIKANIIVTAAAADEDTPVTKSKKKRRGRPKNGSTDLDEVEEQAKEAPDVAAAVDMDVE